MKCCLINAVGKIEIVLKLEAFFLYNFLSIKILWNTLQKLFLNSAFTKSSIRILIEIKMKFIICIYKTGCFRTNSTNKNHKQISLRQVKNRMGMRVGPFSTISPLEDVKLLELCCIFFIKLFEIFEIFADESVKN